MKIMLLTAATGGGHIRAANAIEQYIRENTRWEVENVDCQIGRASCRERVCQYV